MASFWIHSIQMSSDSYEDLIGSLIKLPEVKCMAYSIKMFKREIAAYIYIYIERDA